MYDDDNFKFSSKKLNKTLLTYIFAINGGLSENKALILSSKLRGHLDIKNIFHYIKLNLEQINSLSKILFERGEFGYI